MQESIGVFLLVVVALFVLRLPLRRMRSLRVESRIGNAALDFNPPLPRPREAHRALMRAVPELPAAGGLTRAPQRAAAPHTRRAAPRKRKRRKR